MLIGNNLVVTVEFVSELITCIKNKKNEIVSGDSEKIKKVYDTWKFSKDLRSTNTQNGVWNISLFQSRVLWNAMGKRFPSACFKFFQKVIKAFCPTAFLQWGLMN